MRGDRQTTENDKRRNMGSDVGHAVGCRNVQCSLRPVQEFSEIEREFKRGKGQNDNQTDSNEETQTLGCYGGSE
jgi:hypothetical protein